MASPWSAEAQRVGLGKIILTGGLNPTGAGGASVYWLMSGLVCVCSLLALCYKTIVRGGGRGRIQRLWEKISEAGEKTLRELVMSAT